MPVKRNRSNVGLIVGAAIATVGMAVAAFAQPASAPPAQPAKPAMTPPAAPPHAPAAIQPGGMPAQPTSQAFPPGQGPQIVFDTPTYEFGKMMAGDPIRHDFWFTNRGKATLEILTVRPSCGCTTAGDWDKKVEPGKTGKIPIMLRTEKVSGDIQKNVVVTTNVPDQPTVTLWLKGKIWQAIEVQPPFINLGSITDNKPHSTTAKLVCNLEEKIIPKNVKCDNPVFRAEVKPVKEGKEYTIEVTANPPLKLGPNHTTITLETGHPKSPTLSIQAMCYAPASVEVNPSRLIMPGGSLPQEMERAVYVTHNTPTPLKISDIKVNDEKVQCRLLEDLPGKRFRVVLKFPVGFTVPTGDTLKLTFKTDDPSLPNSSVPISPVRMAPAASGAMPYRQPIAISPAAKPAGGAAPMTPVVAQPMRSAPTTQPAGNH